MPRTRELDLSADHVECPACHKWVQYDSFNRHWAGARHSQTYGLLDFEQLRPRKLNPLWPMPETFSGPSPAVVDEQGPENPQEEYEQSGPVGVDEDYWGAGMRAWCLILMCGRASNNRRDSLHTPLSRTTNGISKGPREMCYISVRGS
jgi:hypothetical protein